MINRLNAFDQQLLSILIPVGGPQMYLGFHKFWVFHSSELVFTLFSDLFRLLCYVLICKILKLKQGVLQKHLILFGVQFKLHEYVRKQISLSTIAVTCFVSHQLAVSTLHNAFLKLAAVLAQHCVYYLSWSVFLC